MRRHRHWRKVSLAPCPFGGARRPMRGDCARSLRPAHSRRERPGASALRCSPCPLPHAGKAERRTRLTSAHSCPAGAAAQRRCRPSLAPFCRRIIYALERLQDACRLGLLERQANAFWPPFALCLSFTSSHNGRPKAHPPEATGRLLEWQVERRSPCAPLVFHWPTKIHRRQPGGCLSSK